MAKASVGEQTFALHLKAEKLDGFEREYKTSNESAESRPQKGSEVTLQTSGTKAAAPRSAGGGGEGEETLMLHILAHNLAEPTREFIKRYEARIQFSLHCWTWAGAKTGNGYGAVRVNGRQVGAHVAAYVAAHGPVPPSHQVMHICDNPLCVRHDHLTVGTCAENMADRTQKGRAASGERNGRAKLTESDVSEIRGLLAAKIAKKVIARRFGVSDTLIGYIAKGANWSDGKPRSIGEETLCNQLREHGIEGWVREHRFASDRKWRFDLAWPARMLAVEIEGGTWSGGRHTRGSGYAKDLEKYNAAARQGWLVLRYTTDQVKSGEAIAEVSKVMRGE